MASFDAARWLIDAFEAGIFVRKTTEGHLRMELLHAEPGDADRLCDALDADRENSRAVLALLPRPGTDALLVN